MRGEKIMNSSYQMLKSPKELSLKCFNEVSGLIHNF